MTSEDVTKLSFGQLLQAKLHEIPNEDPMSYIKYMYSTIHPGLVQLALKDSKAAIVKESKKSGKPVNVYLTMGAEGMDQSFYTGAVSALLWLQDYIDIAKTNFDCSQTDVDIVKKVLRKIGLPHVSDARVDDKEDQKLVATSTCRHYASFLGSLVQWASTGVTSTQIQGKMRSNLELSRFLSKLALGSFPSIPFTAFYVGSLKTNDMMELTERMSRLVDFNKYMTPESVELNQPKFVVQTDNAPLIGITGHPLSNIVYGQENNGQVEWYGLFQESEEFSRLCVKNGVSVKDVKKYIYQTSWKEHQANVTKGDRLALFIQNQNIIKEVFELRHKEYGIENEEGEGYEI